MNMKCRTDCVSEKQPVVAAHVLLSGTEDDARQVPMQGVAEWAIRTKSYRTVHSPEIRFGSRSKIPSVGMIRLKNASMVQYGSRMHAQSVIQSG